MATILTKSDIRLKNEIDTQGPSNPQYRTLREWIEELYEEGIFFLPSGDAYVYKRIEDMTHESIIKYIWTEIKRASSIFKKINRLRLYMSRKQKDFMYNGGLLNGEELPNEEQ